MPSYYFFSTKENQANKKFLLQSDANNANLDYGTFHSQGLTLAKSHLNQKCQRITKDLLSDIARCYREAEKKINSQYGCQQQDIDNEQVMCDIATSIACDLFSTYRAHQNHDSDQYYRDFYRVMLTCCTELLANGYAIADKQVISQVKVEIMCAAQFVKIYSSGSTDDEFDDQPKIKDSGCLGFNDNYARLVAFGSNLWGAVLSFVSYDREIERFRYHLQSFLDDIMPSIHKAASIVSPTSQHNVYADHKILENLGLINAAPESITSRFRL